MTKSENKESAVPATETPQPAVKEAAPVVPPASAGPVVPPASAGPVAASAGPVAPAVVPEAQAVVPPATPAVVPAAPAVVPAAPAVVPAAPIASNVVLAGSVYVQVGVGGGLGVASYHFKSPTECFISYVNAPPDWKLDNNMMPPPEKYFTRTSYNDVTRTFKGVIEWPTLARWGDDYEWDYMFTFSETFDEIVSGTCTSKPSGNIDSYGRPLTSGVSSNDALLRYKRWTPEVPVSSSTDNILLEACKKLDKVTEILVNTNEILVKRKTIGLKEVKEEICEIKQKLDETKIIAEKKASEKLKGLKSTLAEAELRLETIRKSKVEKIKSIKSEIKIEKSKIKVEIAKIQQKLEEEEIIAEMVINEELKDLKEKLVVAEEKAKEMEKAKLAKKRKHRNKKQFLKNIKILIKLIKDNKSN